MSNLVINQLENNDTVDINLRFTESKTLHAVRLKLLKHGVITDGVFKLQIMDGVEVLAESVLSLTNLSSLAIYAHGYFKFDLPYPVRINTSRNSGPIEVTFRVSVTGHTNSDSNYIGLVKQHEFKFIDEFGTYPALASTEAEKAWYSPYGLEIYTYSNK